MAVQPTSGYRNACCVCSRQNGQCVCVGKLVWARPRKNRPAATLHTHLWDRCGIDVGSEGYNLWTTYLAPEPSIQVSTFVHRPSPDYPDPFCRAVHRPKPVSISTPALRFTQVIPVLLRRATSQQTCNENISNSQHRAAARVCGRAPAPDSPPPGDDCGEPLRNNHLAASLRPGFGVLAQNFGCGGRLEGRRHGDQREVEPRHSCSGSAAADCQGPANEFSVLDHEDYG